MQEIFVRNMVIKSLGQQMSDLIRGGQVTFHKFRMLMQVSKVLWRIAIVLVIISVIYNYYKNISSYEWNIGFNWVKVQFLKEMKGKNHKITYRNEHQVLQTIRIKDFEKNLRTLKIIKKFETTFYKAMVTASIMLTLIIGGLLIFFVFKGKYIKLNQKIRGIFLSNDLKTQIKKHNHKIADYKSFTLAGFEYPIIGRKGSFSTGEQAHTLILGSTGAGKTKIIQDLVYQLHQRNQKAIIVDVKGDYITRFYRKSKGDIILNPLDKRGRNWNFFKETNALKGFSSIARAMLPKESKSDPIWVEAARAVFAEFATLYMHENISLSEFRDKILKTDLKTLTKLLKQTPASKIINDDIEKAALSVLMVLATYLRPLKLYNSTEECFSITDWINDNSQQNFLFISSRADVKEDLNPIITAQVDIAVTALRSLKEESNVPKIWFILDELPYFDQSIPGLKDGLAMARSYGGCFILGSQDISSIAKIYSERDAESIANNCKTKVFMNVEGKEAAKWCAASLGEGEIEEWHEGLSYGAHEMRDGIQVNRNKTTKILVLPSELMMLKAGEGFIKFAGFEPSKFKFVDCNFKKIAPGYEENETLLQIFEQEVQDIQAKRREIELNLNQTNQEDNSLLSLNQKEVREAKVPGIESSKAKSKSLTSGIECI